MARYRKKPVVIEAHQWWDNGDHPCDYAEDIADPVGGGTVYTGAYQREHCWEGQVVRYFRRPDIDADSNCDQCSRRFHDHGWIDTLEDGHRVCPGDWIITGIAGERYPCKPDIFDATYELATEAAS